jgi:hypothetical protein
LAPWASLRRQDLLELLDRMNPTIAELTADVGHEAKKRPEVLRLMTHPGGGPLTALALVIINETIYNQLFIHYFHPEKRSVGLCSIRT